MWVTPCLPSLRAVNTSKPSRPTIQTENPTSRFKPRRLSYIFTPRRTVGLRLILLRLPRRRSNPLRMRPAGLRAPAQHPGCRSKWAATSASRVQSGTCSRNFCAPPGRRRWVQLLATGLIIVKKAPCILACQGTSDRGPPAKCQSQGNHAGPLVSVSLLEGARCSFAISKRLAMKRTQHVPDVPRCATGRADDGMVHIA
jgi:hypothetical protein